jgi:hypothetical protein
MEILSLILIGIGLSMDAFSLALCYGVLNLEKAKIRLLSLIVGSFHFFMPLFGMLLGNILEHYIMLDMRYAVFIIFMISCALTSILITYLYIIIFFIISQTNTIPINAFLQYNELFKQIIQGK